MIYRPNSRGTSPSLTHFHIGTHPTFIPKKCPVSFLSLTGAHLATPLFSNSCRNGGTTSRRSDVQTCSCSNAFPICPLSTHAVAHSFALFCTFLHSSKTQLVSFHALPHSLYKNGGVGCTARSLPPYFPASLLPRITGHVPRFSAGSIL